MEELVIAIRNLIAESMEVETAEVKDLKVSFNVRQSFQHNDEDGPGAEAPKRRGRKPGVKRGPKPGAKYKKRDSDVIAGAGADPLY